MLVHAQAFINGNDKVSIVTLEIDVVLSQMRSPDDECKHS